MWDWAFTWTVLIKLLKVLKITFNATVVAFVLSLALGLLLALGRRSRLRFLAWFSGAITEFIRSTPLLVQLYFVFYVLPKMGISLGPFAAGVLGMGLHYSTYLSEVYRAGIEAVPRSQWEAAIALNFSRLQVWVRIILPQALPPMVPVFGNYLIVMFKETPLLSAITLVEMVQTAKIIGSQSFQYLEAFTLVGLLFFLLSYTSAFLVRRLEQRLNRRGPSA